MIRLCVSYVVCCVAAASVVGQTNVPDPLSFFFGGKYGQVEVGGRFAGTEFHSSRPLPSRISFFYPVANSIDLSTDYWRRDESQPMVVGIQVDGGKRRWLGKEPWSYTLSPHKVKFEREEEGLSYTMSYDFCLNEPALVYRLCAINAANRPQRLVVYTHLRLSLRTCQTYATKEPVSTAYDSSTGAVIARFDHAETNHASCFVLNAGATPTQWTTGGAEIGVTDSGTSMWSSSSIELQRRLSASNNKGNPVAAFVYERILQPNDSLEIVQVIGTARRDEVGEKLSTIASAWHQEIEAYDTFVRTKALTYPRFGTGDAWLDKSAVWAKGILAANAHSLGGTIVPMPCPAEYNFFFTHDMLMTDLASVNFDLPRVKSDLLYLASLAKDHIIPHAHYWRDDGLKTEFCTPDNWNHLWFILVSASYLRHSLDDSTVSLLFPLVTKSLEEALKQRRPDNLMYAFRPDWWDIGHVEGPRSYITTLTIRALRDYLFMSSLLNQYSSRLSMVERLADSMQMSLQSKLWDARAKYLMNWNGKQKDPHYYMGSLLAPALALLEEEKAKQLVATAERELVDERIGVRCVMPPDFHTKRAIEFFTFAGDEAGQAYVYINGGVWQHNNAWYALALKNVGRVDDAIRFVRTVMTIDGVSRSPGGIPAMYEYRYSDPSSKEFGRIDKPSFLWAGGFYLYTLYQLFGVQENEWNVSFAGPLPSSSASVTYPLAVGALKTVSWNEKGKYLQACMMNGEDVPSLVVPLETHTTNTIELKFGKPATPYLESVNAILNSIHLNQTKTRLTIRLSSFVHHQTVAHIVAPTQPKSASLNGQRLSSMQSKHLPDGLYKATVRFVSPNARHTLEVQF